MSKLRKMFTGLAFLLVLMFFTGPVYAEEKHVENEEEMSVIYFHLAQVILSLVVALFVLKVTKATGQESIFIYIPIGMIFFIISAIVGYLPHLSTMSEHTSELYVLSLNTIALGLIGISFYKWEKMLE